MLGSRSVASSLDAGIKLVFGPRRRRGQSGNSLVSPGLEEVDSWVIDLVKIGREIGASSKVVHKGFPGFGVLEVVA